MLENILKDNLNKLRAMDNLDDDYDCFIQLEYCYLNLLEGLCNYEFVIDFCLKHNIKSITDIGTACSVQGALFNEFDIEYNAINDSHRDAQDLFVKFNSYQQAHYGVDSVNTDKDSLAVAILSLGWNCYANREQRNHQYECLSKDFNDVLLYIPKEEIEHARKYFKCVKLLTNCKPLTGCFVYASNTQRYL